MHADKENIFNFMKTNVVGKLLTTDETVYILEEGKLEGVYSDEMFFSDLMISENGLQYDMTTITREKIYSIDLESNLNVLKKDYTGVSVFHYELAKRKSSSQLTGIMRLISSTVSGHTMEAIIYGVYDIIIEGNQLKWKEQQMLYRDMPTDKEIFRSVAFDANIRFFMENDKLRFEYIPIYYNVDPISLVKTLSNDQYPTFLTKEK